MAALDATAEHLETRLGSGRLVWRRWGSGNPLVLLHGGYGSWTHWVRNIDTLAAHYAVYAPDLPGLGESDAPPEPFDGPVLARVLADAITAVLPKDERAHVVGFSFGGVVGAPASVLLGRRVRSLTLVGAGGHGPERRPVELRPWRVVTDRSARDAIHRENLGRLMFADPSRIDETTVRIQAANAEAARLKSRPISRGPSLVDAFPIVPASVAAIFGERDATSWPSVQDRLDRLCAVRPDCLTRVIPGAGHWVQYEAPGRFDGALLDVLAVAEAVSDAPAARP